jgi:hypothetical protein
MAIRTRWTATGRILLPALILAVVHPALVHGASSSLTPEQLAVLDLVAQQEMAWASIVIAAATFVQLLLTGAGIHFVRQTLRASQAAVAEAKAATKAATDAVEVTRSIGEAQIRAYVSIDSAHILFEDIRALTAGDPIGIIKKAKAHVTYKNNGQTPAQRVRAVMHMEVHPHPVLTAFHEYSFRSDASVFTIGAGSDSLQPHEMSLTAEQAEFITNRHHAIYVYGRIEYDDIFGRKKHSTYFRFWTRNLKANETRVLFKDSQGNESD